jgi:hypothetical protein
VSPSNYHIFYGLDSHQLEKIRREIQTLQICQWTIVDILLLAEKSSFLSEMPLPGLGGGRMLTKEFPQFLWVSKLCTQCHLG